MKFLAKFLMERLQFWHRAIVTAYQYHPSVLVEGAMFLLSFASLLVGFVMHQWPYYVLSCSYLVGISALFLAEETIAPTTRSRSPWSALIFPCTLICFVCTLWGVSLP